jgi:hypothetical protein
MRTGRPKQALRLTEEEQDRLQSLGHRARSQPLLARRARVVLALPATEYSGRSGSNQKNCETGYAGLAVVSGFPFNRQ